MLKRLRVGVGWKREKATLCPVRWAGGGEEKGEVLFFLRPGIVGQLAI